MSKIGWGDGSPPDISDSYFEGRSGSTGSNPNETSYYCGVVGAYTTVSYSYTWTPTASDTSPVISSGQSYGAFELYITNAGSGTLTVSAVIDGVPAENTIKLALIATGTYGYGYGTVAWAATSFTPTPSQIGWGAPAGGNNTPGNSGFNVANTGITDAFGQTATCGVIGAYSTAVFSHEWIPSVPGAETPIFGAYTAYGAYKLNVAQNRAAGTIRVTAVFDGVAASTVCVLTVAYSNWPSSAATYGGFSWATEGAAPTAGFWTLFVGTEEV